MQPERGRLEQLFQKYFNKTASPAERAELAELMDNPANKEAFMQLLDASWDSYRGDGDILPSATTQAMLERITDSDVRTPDSRLRTHDSGRSRWWLAAAAIVLLAVAGSLWIMMQKTRPSQQPPAIAAAPADIQPGSNGAILILNNGQRIVLDSAHTGLLAQQGNATVTRQDNALVYKGAEDAAGDAGYNTISTPRGRQYSNLVLQDGTKVWLDAGSSIRFPVVFSGKERRVEMSGQAWFEVAHNARQPFKVIARGIVIEDIGTAFNVNAYADEPETKTTLVEGSVRVSFQAAHDAGAAAQNSRLTSPGSRLTTPGSRLLTPGQQATTAGEQLSVSTADIPQTLAWKNGIFFFKDADIKTVMKELARWYDITVEYEGADYTETFSGKIARGLTLRELLDGLAQTRVRYRIDTGNRLVILPPSK